MTYLSIEQVVDAARNDVSRKIKEGRFRGLQDTQNDNEENVHTIISLYSQWAENISEAENSIWTMFNKEFSKFL